MPPVHIDSSSTTSPTGDPRPCVAIGHVSIAVSDIAALSEFYAAFGMRPVADLGTLAILELRGGTHLRLESGEPGHATLDLIVDDIADARAALEELGACPSTVTSSGAHDRFLATDPEGNTLLVQSDHAIGPV